MGLLLKALSLFAAPRFGNNDSHLTTPEKSGGYRTNELRHTGEAK